MQDKDMSKKTSNESAETIDKLVREIAETKDWSVLVPDYDEDALMVHWTSKSLVDSWGIKQSGCMPQLLF